MLWGFIAHDGRKCLQKVFETINSIKYLQILQESLLPEMFLGEKLQQDNAPAHNSILSTTWVSENGLEILEKRPPISPDSNFIENVWSLLKKRVFQGHPKNIEELWAFCQEEFERKYSNSITNNCSKRQHPFKQHNCIDHLKIK